MRISTRRRKHNVHSTADYEVTTVENFMVGTKPDQIRIYVCNLKTAYSIDQNFADQIRRRASLLATTTSITSTYVGLRMLCRMALCVWLTRLPDCGRFAPGILEWDTASEF